MALVVLVASIAAVFNCKTEQQHRMVRPAILISPQRFGKGKQPSGEKEKRRWLN